MFILSSYLTLYLETLRHRKMIRTQQLPQEEEERFNKENKSLMTTVLVVGAFKLCFLPAIAVLILQVSKVRNGLDNTIFILCGTVRLPCSIRFLN